MLRRYSFAPVVILLLFTACRPIRSAVSAKDDGKLELIFVQVNDVYEIAPLSGGKEGGMARVATLKKQQQATNPNTFLVMAGDFVSPSIFNSLQYEGKAVRGKQMIEAMNVAGMDLAVLGNHEFDIKESELQERFDESRFQWVATNAFHNAGGKVVPFRKTGDSASAFPKYHILNLNDADGTSARVAIIGLTLPANRASYVHYTDAFAEAKAAYALLKDSADAVVALTHQSVAEDIRLAKEVPGLALVLGGHEHDQQYEKVGNVYITKAHSNARSAYVVKMTVNKGGGVTIAPQLKYLNEAVPLDAATDSVVKKWIGIADRNFSTSGFDARKVVLATGSPLDGRETEIRHRTTNLTQLVVAAMEYAAPKADAVFFNSGSIRVDDILNLPVTQYDVLRAMPFGGGIREVDMRGSLLQKILTAGRGNVGNGGFLQYSGALTFNEGGGQWLLKGTPIDAQKTYRVAMSDFLLTGKETNLDFLNPQNPEIVTVHEAQTGTTAPLSDIRLAIVRYLESKR